MTDLGLKYLSTFFKFNSILHLRIMPVCNLLFLGLTKIDY